jgi:hypothetical protein
MNEDIEDNEAYSSNRDGHIKMTLRCSESLNDKNGTIDVITLVKIDGVYIYVG